MAYKEYLLCFKGQNYTAVSQHSSLCDVTSDSSENTPPIWDLLSPCKHMNGLTKRVCV